jgi:hypothetical protein
MNATFIVLLFEQFTILLKKKPQISILSAFGSIWLSMENMVTFFTLLSLITASFLTLLTIWLKIRDELRTRKQNKEQTE